MNTDHNIILSILEENGFETRIVGGAVRDIILKKIPNDIDIATKATPSDIYHIFSEQNLKKYKISNFKIIPTGIKHGTLSIILNSNRYEVTTLRSDYNADGRHAEVRFETSWEKDAERRDFKFNALYMDINGKIYDYFGGIKDLKNTCINFIGNAEKRISEDYLRILRYFRFVAQLGLDTSNLQTSKDCIVIKKLSQNIKKLSKERIRYEIFKILDSKNSLNVLLMMDSLCVLENIIDIDINIINKIRSYQNIKFISKIFEKISSIGKLLLIYSFKNYKKFFTDINISRKEKKIFYDLITPLPFKLSEKDDILRNILFLKNSTNIIDIMLLNSLKALLNNEISENYIQIILNTLGNINHTYKNDFQISYNELKKYNIQNKDISKITLDARIMWSKSLGTIPTEECIKQVIPKYQ